MISPLNVTKYVLTFELRDILQAYKILPKNANM